MLFTSPFIVERARRDAKELSRALIALIERAGMPFSTRLQHAT